jgi:hypothetical protein
MKILDERILMRISGAVTITAAGIELAEGNAAGAADFIENPGTMINAASAF